MTKQEKAKKILSLEYPILGLSPMDGISDASFRYITKKYGNPDFMMTEFTNVMGLIISAERLLHHFQYAEMERPIVGQIYGAEPEYFYHAAKIVVALGFDAVDINMGCPAQSVSSRGAGAGLIRTPDLAREIIYEVKRGVDDWVREGKLTGMKSAEVEAVEKLITKYKLRITKEDIERVVPSLEGGLGRVIENDFPKGIFNLLDERHKNVIVDSFRDLNASGESNSSSNVERLTSNRHAIPVSVKTRIGYDKPITESWIQNVAKAEPNWISVHGRFLKQMYHGNADWNELKKAVDCTDLPILTNGDVHTMEDAYRMLEQTGSAGVLIGRASQGNPTIFRQKNGNTKYQKPNSKELQTADWKLIPEILLEHAEHFEKMHEGNERAFVQMRKHLGWYTQTMGKLIIKNEELKIGDQASPLPSPVGDGDSYVEMLGDFPSLEGGLGRVIEANLEPTTQTSLQDWLQSLGFQSLKELRMKLIQVKNLSEIKSILKID